MSISDTNMSLCETHIALDALPAGLPARETYSAGAGTREWIVSSALCPALAAHEINLLGVTEAGPDFCFVRPAPTGSQLLACTGGAGWVWIDARWERCAAGQVYVTPPHALHAYRAGGDAPWHLCWVQSDGDWLRVCERPLLLTGETGLLAEAISGLHREVMHPAAPDLLPPWAFLASSYARRLVQPGGGDPRLRFLWDAVNADLAAPWTVDKLAGRSRREPGASAPLVPRSSCGQPHAPCCRASDAPRRCASRFRLVHC